MIYSVLADLLIPRSFSEGAVALAGDAEHGAVAPPPFRQHLDSGGVAFRSPCLTRNPFAGIRRAAGD